MGDSVFDKERKRRNKEINRKLTMTVSQRLYLVDTKTGDKILLAEAIPEGWYPSINGLWSWLAGRDMDATHGTEPTTLFLKTEGVNE
jgi:hypothetical protein